MSSDWKTTLRVGHCADQICKAIEHKVPSSFFHKFAFLHFFDLRNVVDEIPKLGIVCTTGIWHAGGAKQPSHAPFSYIILFPNLLFKKLNRAIIQSQTLLHHELTHILLGHADTTNYAPKRSSAYFNHPHEMTAFFQQGAAALARECRHDSWRKENARDILGDDRDCFVEKFQRALFPEFWRALSFDNQKAIVSRAANFWNEGQQSTWAKNPEAQL